MAAMIDSKLIMKINIPLLSSVWLALAAPLYADIANTNGVTWDGSVNALNTSYNQTGAAFDALNLQVTVNPGYQFDFNSLNIFLGYSGAGSGGAPSPYLEIVDSLNNVVATTPTVPMTTALNGFYNITSYAAAVPYEMTFTPSSTVALDPGTYDFEIWDTGEQLNYMISGGAISTTEVNVTAGPPYAGNNAATPALSMGDTVGPVPEPSTVALLGMAGLVFIRRFRRSC